MMNRCISKEANPEEDASEGRLNRPTSRDSDVPGYPVFRTLEPAAGAAGTRL